MPPLDPLTKTSILQENLDKEEKPAKRRNRRRGQTLPAEKDTEVQKIITIPQSWEAVLKNGCCYDHLEGRGAISIHTLLLHVLRCDHRIL